MSDSHYKQHVVIQFVVNWQKKPLKSSQQLQMVYEYECMSKTRPFERANWFKEEWKSVEGDPRKGAPITSRTDTNVNHLHTLISSDRQLSIRALSDELNINK